MLVVRRPALAHRLRDPVAARDHVVCEALDAGLELLGVADVVFLVRVVAVPNAALLRGPISLSCAMSSRLRSTHVRVSVVCARGLTGVTSVPAVIRLTNLLKPALIAVLPSPNGS